MPNLEQVVDLIALATLTHLMDADNSLAIAVVGRSAPPGSRGRARALGLAISLVFRLALLLLLVYVLRVGTMSLRLAGHTIALRDTLLLLAGLFLLVKSVREIFNGAWADSGKAAATAARPFASIVLQIALVDLTLSVDSIVTVVGMASNVGLMIAVIAIDVVLLFFSASVISLLTEKHPSLDTLIVCALLLVGVELVSVGVGLPIDKRYIYAMMAFAFFVELVNLRKERIAPGYRAAHPCESKLQR